MTEIENLFKLETEIVKQRVVFKFVYTEIPITQLRMLKTIEMVKEVLESLQKTEIHHVSFIFVINQFTMPTNVSLIKDFASTFHPYTDIINEKLDFTIIQSNSSLFKLFFSFFKMYYEPIKPLYLCESDESTKNCLESKNERSKVPDFSDYLNENSQNK
tara:strand:- start:40 stop:516 length:477 start_codon:yes stop_codon:yes gene_type:complete